MPLGHVVGGDAVRVDERLVAAFLRVAAGEADAGAAARHDAVAQAVGGGERGATKRASAVL